MVGDERLERMKEAETPPAMQPWDVQGSGEQTKSGRYPADEIISPGLAFCYQGMIVYDWAGDC